MSTGRNPSSPRAHETAFSLVEILCGMAIMFVGLLSLAGSTVTGTATRQTNLESAQALQAARRFLESMQVGDVPFEGLFVAYAREPVTQVVTEETGGGLLQTGEGLLKNVTGVLAGGTSTLGPLLSRSFAVAGLEPRKDDPDGTIGELIFPVADGPEGPELREDVAGRDLNADGVIDSEDHTNDYVILPVTVRVEWKGTRGVRQIELHSLLVRR